MHLNDLRLRRVRLHHVSKPLADIPGEVRRAVAPLLPRVTPGMRIAITAGSRGISNLDIIIKELVAELRGAGAQPFIIPAMGSHGGGTAAYTRRFALCE